MEVLSAIVLVSAVIVLVATIFTALVWFGFRMIEKRSRMPFSQGLPRATFGFCSPRMPLPKV